MKKYKENHSKDVFSEMIPQALTLIKKSVLDPIFGNNLMRKYADEKSPLRSILYSSEQMQQHAVKLARSHRLTEGPPSELLLKRLAENEDVLIDVHSLISETVKVNKRLAPAGEWLLDNFYLIEEQIYIGKKHLPKGYSKELPKLAKGQSQGLPRVYDIAVEIISHSDGRIDEASLSAFIKSYQTISTLKLGELWAIPIMLRLALLENLRRLSAQIAVDILNKNLANYWADQMTTIAEKDPKNLVLIIADMARSNPPMESSFVAELTRRLQGKGSMLALPLSWIEQRLSENGATSLELVYLESQKLAADQMSISNCISGLRFLNTNDWRDFVEGRSLVEQILRQDINNTYAKMDFFTRDRYRHIIEKIAKNSPFEEEKIAGMAIALAKKNAENKNTRLAHVGYYLIGNGLPSLEKMASDRNSFLYKSKKWLNSAPLMKYSAAIAAVTFFTSWLLINQATSDGLMGWSVVAIGFICAISASQPSVTIINWLVTKLTSPNLLPRLDFSSGIPKEFRSLIVIPSMLSCTKVIEDLLESLEVHFLANRDEHLHFALLTDYTDSDAETQEEDAYLLEMAKNKIIALNRKYDRTNNEIFFLLHRPRKWNAKEKKWMGMERKRGKLAALNALMRGKDDNQFSLVLADQSFFPEIKYIITLDSDTSLPREAAWKMIGTIAHPMNHAFYDEKKQRITEGYAILQPRVSSSLPGPASSIYKKIHENESGTDPYTHAVSDVYQDFFHEASFIGKGIYEIDAFEKTLNNRFPNNRILSHDLLEGNYARCGLISDVQLYESYPDNYITDMKRHYRWIRGDWQIAQWLLPRVPSPDKALRRNALSVLSLWKIFDNLRRSFVPIAFVMLIIYGCIVSKAPAFWILFVIGMIAYPSLICLAWDIIKKPKDTIIWQHTVYSIKSVYNNFMQHILQFVFLPYHALISLSAIAITHWRLLFSHKNFLEWNSHHHITLIGQKNIKQAYQTMWFSPALGLGLLAYIILHPSAAILIEIPLFVTWILSPAIELWISKPYSKKEETISKSQTLFLHKLSRKTWGFFEDFVTEEENWLPPDNFQMHPEAKIAHRTSPTNIGLALLSNLTAYDFGYLTAKSLIERTTQTMNTIQKMDTFKGHLYNWYDTKSLTPLAPRYVSSVDSGNLTAHLIVLKQGLLSLIQDKIFPTKAFDGLLDTVEVIMEKKTKHMTIEQFRIELEFIRFSPPQTMEDTVICLDSIDKSFKKISSVSDEQTNSEVALWISKLDRQINDLRNEMVTLMIPWIMLKPPPSLKLEELERKISFIPTLAQLANADLDLLPFVKEMLEKDGSSLYDEWALDFEHNVIKASIGAKKRIAQIEDLAKKCTEFSAIEYDFLYDKTKHLLVIGFNADENKRDNSYYDLLASEARLTTFTAIAQGKLPQESWFALGRQITSTMSSPSLLSWSGSMFEYLMPLLVMPSFENTLLDQTNRVIVQRQIGYGKKRGVPWGISESGYNAVDTELNYQYRAFGVPGLGFKRGLNEDLVISPYSTVMALMVSPVDSCKNMEHLVEEGFEGEYGFYEAIDYTSSRLPRGKNHTVIKSFMSHHLGMSFLSLSHLLHKQPMQKRFSAEVQFQAALLLLQERIPRVSTFYSPVMHISASSVVVEKTESPIHVIKITDTAVPEVQLLSNGKYHLMVTNAGGGYSRWKDISVTRWREDITCDNWGTFCYIKDVELDNNQFWSASFQPSLKTSEKYEAVFSQGRAEFRRLEYGLETHTEIVVSPEDDVELRRLIITNRTRKKRQIRVTSYAEVVLANPNADMAHPAFSNLFVETAINKERHAIICTRRPRSSEEHPPSMFHLMKLHNAEMLSVSYETDRNQFIGRGNTIQNPASIHTREGLSGTQGSVLDPIVSIQYEIIINPFESASIDMLIGIAETKELCQSLIEKYQDRNLRNRSLELSWTHSQVVLRQINASEADAQLYSKLAGSIIFSNPSMRANQNIIIENRRGQSSLWSYSISGDLPIVLIQIEDIANIGLVKQLIQAHTYWRLKGLIVDLVIWNEDYGGYRQDLQNAILALITPAFGAEFKEKPGGIFFRSADQISNEDRTLFQALARIVVSDRQGSLEEQVTQRVKTKSPIPNFVPIKFDRVQNPLQTLPIPEGLQFFNGLGGFSPDGKEYIITTSEAKRTPAPWINVLANPNFGSVISENGQSYSWFENAHEYRLTPWNNDPVSDTGGEVFFLRDEENGKWWSPTPTIGQSDSAFITKHGFGYSIFQHMEENIFTEMCVFVDLELSVKYIMIKCQNKSKRPRKLSVTGYVEWVLGDYRSKTQMHILTQLDGDTGALLAKNHYNTDFENRTAFFDMDEKIKYFTTDRTEFIGRNGTIRKPEAMRKAKLSGKTGAAIDPCAALQAVFELEEDEEYEITFRLGALRDNENIINTIRKLKGTNVALEALDKVKKYWQQATGVLTIETPNAALNILTNGWLTYQTLACRIWARSGFYQSGGAFGFRDQLQDVLSILFTKPEIAHQQILLNASRQFFEGDVQHWWHPPAGRGVRTTCSDDYLWLPFVTIKYVTHTGDVSILDETIPFLDGRALKTGESSYFDLPAKSEKTASLYEHCVKSIDFALKFGFHGLPLMGSGDWNDGMDKVGEEGKGESVWLAFFLFDILTRFVEISELKKDHLMAEKCKTQAEILRTNIENNAWDGEWYRRAYFDDGTPLGSSINKECSIDSIVQSWSVLSKTGDSKRAEIALNSAEKFLVRQDASLIQLFEPPFDKSELNPGYIKGYVPGIRENGGQYTHAAIWLIMAFAAIKDKEKTWNLLQMINPINHGNNEKNMATYKVEPYVMAADIYADPLHIGRGGWTWYTGSAGWMYQLIMESFLGITQKGNTLFIDPCLPDSWHSININYQYLQSSYNITIENDRKNSLTEIYIDDHAEHQSFIPLQNDGNRHVVKVYLGNRVDTKA